MPINTEREYRAAEAFQTREKQENGGDFIVEGYASTFKPYEMWQDEDGTKYYEQIDARAFDETDTQDVIFQYNHSGKVYARTRNNTLKLSVDEHGLKVTADLSSTTAAKEMWEEIRSGLIDQMSFAFTVSEDSYNRETHTRIIRKVKKLYDVSAVSIPANPDTNISARDYFSGVAEMEKQERQARAEREKRLAEIKKLLEA